MASWSRCPPQHGLRMGEWSHSPPNSAAEYHDYWERIIGWYRDHFADDEEDEGAGGLK